MLPSSWKPVACANLARLGSPHDGGYVVSRDAVTVSTLLLSLGLGSDWSFDQAFREASGARVVCLDRSVGPRFWARYTWWHLRRGRMSKVLRFLAYRKFFNSPEVQHRREMVGYESLGFTRLARLFGETTDAQIFLKIDIEGGEYRLLDDIVAHRDRLTGLVIEFHDIDLHREAIDRFCKRFTGFSIVWLHANNLGGIDPEGDPLVIEMSFAPEEYVVASDDRSAMASSANSPRRPDISVRYAPEGFDTA